MIKMDVKSSQNSVPHPSFIVVGAQRCGTTWLHENLNVHPDIYLPEQKEVNFFSDIDGNWEKGFDWYSQQFISAAPNAVVGEITPEYFVDPISPERIFNALGKIKIICILREPVERAFSSYKKGLRELNWECSFSEFIGTNMDYSVSRGIYCPQLKRYIEKFGSNNVLILKYEQIEKEPNEVLKDIYSFIGVDDSFSSPLVDSAFNVGASSSAIVKLAVFLRNILYLLPFGRPIFKRFQRTKVGNKLMNKFLKSQAAENDDEGMLLGYRHYFECDLKMLTEDFGIEFKR